MAPGVGPSGAGGAAEPYPHPNLYPIFFPFPPWLIWEVGNREGKYTPSIRHLCWQQQTHTGVILYCIQYTGEHRVATHPEVLWQWPRRTSTRWESSLGVRMYDIVFGTCLIFNSTLWLSEMSPIELNNQKNWSFIIHTSVDTMVMRSCALQIASVRRKRSCSNSWHNGRKQFRVSVYWLSIVRVPLVVISGNYQRTSNALHTDTFQNWQLEHSNCQTRPCSLWHDRFISLQLEC